MLTDRQRLGIRGERVAARWLVEQGWSILDRRFRHYHRDIDLVIARRDAYTGGRLVAFVEVRTKQSVACGTPAETVTREKRRHVAQAAQRWIMSNGRSGDVYRFDVVGVLIGPTQARVQYIPDAFWLERFG
jgi:putative endonuclease